MTKLFILFLLNIFPCVFSGCPNGTVPGPGSSNFCYGVYNFPANWFGAATSCQSMGGNLATVPDAFTNSFLLNLSMTLTGPQILWIGGSFPVKLIWNDGTSSNYTNWGNGQPRNQTYFDTVGLYIPTGKWYLEEHSSQKPYICQFPQKNPAPFCSDGWTYFAATLSCYHSIPGWKDYQDARTACLNAGGDIASIHSHFENTIIEALSYNSNIPYVWTGLVVNNATDNSTWVWSDGTTLDYTYWQVNNPQNGKPSTYIPSINDNFDVPWISSYLSSGYGASVVCKGMSFS